MNKVIALVVIIIVVVGGFMLMNKKPDTSETATEQSQAPAETQKVAAEIIYENGAWKPATVTVKTGEAVRITNKHTSTVRAVSNPHPFHTSQPDFDSDSLDSGGSYIYTTKGPGKIEYHNHFNPGVMGEIVIQ